MRNHRTTARGALLLIALAAASLAAATAARALGTESRTARKTPIVFPVAGAAEYFNDWGAPRGQGRHAGIDILTTWRSAAVAAEDGKVVFWTTSARAGCMLYLYGASGTTYRYIHLNNDLTRKHDNAGACVPGVAYAKGLTDGALVKAGEQIGYNGDSGDAEGIYHLHFEVHPRDRADVNPFPFLNRATRLLFPLPANPDRPVILGLKGLPVSAGAGVLELSVTAVRVWPGLRWTSVEARSIELHVPEDAKLDAAIAEQVAAPTRRSLSARQGGRLLVFTRPAPATFDVISATPGALVVDRVRPS